MPGPASLHGILPAATSRSSNLSRVKSQISGLSAERDKVFSLRFISSEPSGGGATSPARQSSVLFGFMGPDVLLLADARSP